MKTFLRLKFKVDKHQGTIIKTTSQLLCLLFLYVELGDQNYLPEEVRDLLYAAKQAKPSSQSFLSDCDITSLVPLL